PALCTECVGFHDEEACAAVCPVDCCILDPNNLESEDALLQRAQKLHPEKTFPSLAELPAHLSRFRRPTA
ncbi:MAG: 4Fe-4S ferredoxin, partial [Myxococcales bacterium]